MPPGLGLGGGASADPASTLFGAPNLVLDNYPGAHRAYSVRKLSKTYTGYAMKVREGSGMDYTADVAFDDDGFVSASSKVYNTTGTGAGGGGDGDTLDEFLGSPDGHVHTWYDQSGEGSNATDLTGSPTLANQPKIYTGGSLITDVTGSGTPRAALEFDVADKLHISNSGFSLGSTSVFTTSRVTSTATQILWWLSNGAPKYMGGALFSVAHLFYYAGNVGNASVSAWDGSALINIRRHQAWITTVSPSPAQSLTENAGSVVYDSSASGETDAAIGAATEVGLGNTIGYGFIGKVQEFIAYDSDQTANRGHILADTNTVLEVY